MAASQPKAIDESKLSAAELQKAIDEKAQSVGKKKTAPKKAAASKTKAATKPAAAKKAAATKPKPSADSVPIKVKISKPSAVITDNDPGKNTTEAAPKIRTHGAKMIKPPSEEQQEEKQEQPEETTAESAPAAEQQPKEEAVTIKTTVKPETSELKETAPAAETKEPAEAPKKEPSAPESKDDGAVAEDGATAAAYSSTDLDNLARQIGGDRTKTPLEEAEQEQQNLKTFDTKQYHLPIRPNRHHRSGMDFVYYFIVVLVVAVAALYVTNELELIDLPILKDV